MPQISFLNLYIIAIISFFLIAYGFAILWFPNDTLLLFHGLFYLIPTIIAIIIIKKLGERKINEIKLNPIYKNTSLYIYFCIFLFLIAAYNLNFITVGITLFICAILFTIIFVQVCFITENIWIFFIELISLSLFSIFRVTLGYPLYFGATDILVHLDYANIILSTGHLLPTDYMSYYNDFPLSHIINVISSILFKSDIRTSFFIISGISFCFSVLVLYAIIRSFFEKKIAMISCLLYSTTSTIIFFGLYMVPRSWALWGFSFLFLFMIKIGKSKNNYYQYIIISTIISLFLVFVHSGSNFTIILILLLYLVILSLSTQKIEIRNFFIIAVYSIVYIFYILYNSQGFLDQIQTIIHTQFLETQVIVRAVTPIIGKNGNYISDGYIFFINNFTSIMLYLFIIIGVGIMINKKDEFKYSYVFIALSLCSLPFWLPSILVYFPFFNNFILNRLELFTFPFIFSIFGYSVYYIVKNNHYGIKWIRYFTIIIFFSYSLMSLGTIPFIDYDLANELHFRDTRTYTPYFNNEDLDILSFVYKNTDDGSLISADYYAARYFEGKTYFSSIENYDLKYFQIVPITNFKSSDIKQSYFIFREGELKKTKTLAFSQMQITFENYKYIEDYIKSKNSIYSSKNNLLYLN